MTNVEAAPNADAARIPALLRRQVTAPVRFTEMVQNLFSLGVTRLLEVGPGRILSGLVARIERSVGRAHFGAMDELEPARIFLSESAG